MISILAAAALSLAGGGQPQHFVLTGKTLHGVDSPIRVVGTGPIRGRGVAVDAEAAKVGHLTIRLAKGTVRITDRETGIAAHPDPQACKAALVAHGRYAIVGGTGAYAGATGVGTFVRHQQILGARSASGSCLGRNAPPAAVYSVVQMTGTASLH